jgi:hypothetical protein
MNYYLIEPQAAGHFGKESIFIDRSVRPPIIATLHFEFDSWLGDDIVTNIGIYIGTRRLADLLQSSLLDLSGVHFKPIKISKSPEYYWLEHRADDSAPKQLPEFLWFDVSGVPGIDDFGNTEERELVISERVLSIMKLLKLDWCDIQKYRSQAERSEGING